MSDAHLTVVDDGIDRLIEQFKGSVNLVALLTSYLNQCQALEDAAWPLLGERSLDNATGDRLDGIGELINLPRGGRDDTAYRLALQVEFAIIRSNGTEAAIMEIVDLVMQAPSTDYEFTEYAKTVVIRPINDDFSGFTANPAAARLRRAVSAGTKIFLVAALRLDSILFTLSSSATVLQTSSSLGLANDSQTTGGNMAWAY